MICTRTQGQTASDTISISKVVILDPCLCVNLVERKRLIRPRFVVGEGEYEGGVSRPGLLLEYEIGDEGSTLTSKQCLTPVMRQSHRFDVNGFIG